MTADGAAGWKQARRRRASARRGVQARSAPRERAAARRAGVARERRRRRREQLIEVYNEASVRPVPAARRRATKVVFGAGNADADLMFVGEAPGAEEDRQGLPFVGRAGQLLTSCWRGSA